MIVLADVPIDRGGGPVRVVIVPHGHDEVGVVALDHAGHSGFMWARITVIADHGKVHRGGGWRQAILQHLEHRLKDSRGARAAGYRLAVAPKKLLPHFQDAFI